MIKNTHGLYVVKFDDDGDAIIQSEHSRFRVPFDYDVDVTEQSVRFFVNVKDVYVLINEDCEIFVELSKLDKHFLKSLALVIVEHMENQ